MYVHVLRALVATTVGLLILLAPQSVGAQCNVHLDCECACMPICSYCCSELRCLPTVTGFCWKGDCFLAGVNWEVYTMDHYEPGQCRFVCCVIPYSVCLIVE